MPNIVRNLGDLKRAKNVDGEEVSRQDYIFLPSYGHQIRCLNTDNHFVYYSKRLGSSTLCTCGSPATMIGYEGYRKYVSRPLGLEVLMCYHFFQFGQHADGSH